jgi:parallel beta-helix repeat protein
MIAPVLSVILCLAMESPPVSGAPQAALPKGGKAITSSARFAPQTYRRTNGESDLSGAALTVRGDNITLDFQGAVLEGTPQTVEPDQRRGTGMLVHGRNVTIRNLKIRGYKIGLAAVDSPGLKLENVDASYNWKQRLMSTLDREDSSDWMSFHRNEADEWLRYGGAIYLKGCDNFEVKNCRAIGGQSGLMLTRCNRGLVWNNTFSFNSAIGIGMYRSSENRIMHNNVDWCVRGYSHGKWNRGQDSAGILIYEQSSKNIFAFNSVTHGGDGFFLWAGQTTMDSGKGGCNDNLLYGNDWSHAPTNGIEATFSRNKFVNNLIMECWHGVWGGFSYESLFQGNIFAYNAESVALEHGQENAFLNNIHYRDLHGLVIWQNERVDPDWGYGKFRDTRSRDYLVSGSLFSNIPGNTLSVRDTRNFQVSECRFADCAKLLTLSTRAGIEPPTVTLMNNFADGVGPGDATNLELSSNIFTKRMPHPLPATMHGSGNVIQDYSDDYLSRFETNWDPFAKTYRPIRIGREAPGQALQAQAQHGAKAPKPEGMFQDRPEPLRGGRKPFLKPGTLRGRRYILVDHWGPYDFKSPILWPRGEVRDRRQVFEALGPKGLATVVESLGLAIEAISTDGGKTWKAGGGRAARIPVPSLLRAAFEPGSAIERQLRLRYVGEAVTDYRGIVTPKGKPFDFGFSQFFMPIDWTVKFFAWNEMTDPRTQHEAFRTLLTSNPIKTEKVDRVNYAGNVPGVPGDRYATLAEGTLEAPDGEYVLNVTSDDGVRVWLDGKLLIDEWHWQGPTLYSRPVKLRGKHRLRIEHFEIDGYSALKVEIAKQ